MTAAVASATLKGLLDWGVSGEVDDDEDGGDNDEDDEIENRFELGPRK